MAWIHGLTFLAIIATLVGAQVAPSNVDCTGVAAGTRMWGCKAFHECREDGSSAYVECGWGMVYNEISRNCEYAHEVDTPCGRSYRRECRDYGPPFGKIAVKDYVDPQTGLPCQYFFTCANGHFYGTQKCEGFQVFNEILQYCVKPEAAPSSCNPFGPQVANAQKEVKRHWWKSSAASSKIKEKLKQPWWKAKRADESVKRSFVQQKHWLTSSAAAKRRRNKYPKVEKLSMKSHVKNQEIGSNPVKNAKKSPFSKEMMNAKYSNSKLTKPIEKGRRHFYPRKTTVPMSTSTSEKLISTTTNAVVTTITKANSTVTNSTSRENSIPTNSTNIFGITTQSGRKGTEDVKSTTTSISKTQPIQNQHPWNMQEKPSVKSIAHQEKSSSS